jgi:hypothetical protein
MTKDNDREDKRREALALLAEFIMEAVEHYTQFLHDKEQAKELLRHWPAGEDESKQQTIH